MSTTTTALNLEEFKPFIGRTQVATDVLHPGPANLLRLAFGREEPEYREGDALPPALAGLLFPAALSAGALRPDGSPHDTGVVPAAAAGAAHVRRRAGAFSSPLRIGESCAVRPSWPIISMKSGGTGTLVFATIVSRVFGTRRPGPRGRAAHVFREEVKSGERNQAPRREPAPADVPWRRTITPDPGAAVPLLRADVQQPPHPLRPGRGRWRWRDIPGLVVHGPLTTTLLIDFARDHNPGGASSATPRRRGRRSSTRRPSSCAAARPPRAAGELWAVTPEGTIAMSAEVELQ